MAQSTNEMARFIQTALEKMKMTTLFSVGYESEKRLFENKLTELAKIYQHHDLEVNPKMQFSVRFLFRCFNGGITDMDKVKINDLLNIFKLQFDEIKLLSGIYYSLGKMSKHPTFVVNMATESKFEEDLFKEEISLLGFKFDDFQFEF